MLRTIVIIKNDGPHEYKFYKEIIIINDAYFVLRKKKNVSNYYIVILTLTGGEVS